MLSSSTLPCNRNLHKITKIRLYSFSELLFTVYFLIKAPRLLFNFMFWLNFELKRYKVKMSVAKHQACFITDSSSINCVQTHDFAVILKIFRGLYPRIPVAGGGAPPPALTPSTFVVPPKLEHKSTPMAYTIRLCWQMFPIQYVSLFAC